MHKNGITKHFRWNFVYTGFNSCCRCWHTSSIRYGCVVPWAPNTDSIETDRYKDDLYGRLVYSNTTEQDMTFLCPSTPLSTQISWEANCAHFIYSFFFCRQINWTNCHISLSPKTQHTRHRLQRSINYHAVQAPVTLSTKNLPLRFFCLRSPLISSS